MIIQVVLHFIHFPPTLGGTFIVHNNLVMKKIFVLVLLVMGLHCLAQNKEESTVYLTNYTISQKSNTVGYVKLKIGQIRSIAVGGEHTSAFTIGKDHRLSVKPEKLKPGASWFDVMLTVKTSSGERTETFRIVKDDFIRNKVIAHRGAWKNTDVPENSIAALKHAVRLGCEGSEFDVHMSADSIPVINHDPSIQGVSIAKTNSRELLTIRLTNGETLPTLEDYLKAGIEQSKTKLILEIKASELGKESSLALTRKCVALVEALRAQAWVDYISFDYDVCLEVMKLAPYARAAYLKGDKTPGELEADKFYGLDYHFNVLKKNTDWIADAKNRKLTINVWTVNDKETLEEMLRNNVDFITTNEPELLLSLVK
jgi:glycerophosphoryl diester phosphodiesterase